MTQQTKALLYATATVLCWATVATAFKIALSEITYAKLLLISSFTALVVFATDAIIRGKMADIRKIRVRDAILGALNPFLYYLVLFKAYSLLPAQVAQPLNYSWQIVLLLLSVPLLGAKITRQQVMWLCVSFVGIILISMQGSFSSLRIDSVLGVLLALTSAFVWAFYWIFNSKWSSDMDSSVKLMLNFAFGFVYLLVYCAMFDNFEIPSVKALTASVYVGLFEMGITFIFWAKALSLATNRAAVISLTYLSPVLSMILIYLILGESIYTTTLIGFALIIIGVKLSNRK